MCVCKCSVCVNVNRLSVSVLSENIYCANLMKMPRKGML